MTSYLVCWQVRRNVMDVSYHIAQYTNIISELREEVKRLRVRLDVANRRPTAAAGGAAGAGGAALHDVNPQVERLKQQLLDVFREQMELRCTSLSLIYHLSNNLCIHT